MILVPRLASAGDERKRSDTSPSLRGSEPFLLITSTTFDMFWVTEKLYRELDE